jgi:hypothetical protein
LGNGALADRLIFERTVRSRSGFRRSSALAARRWAVPPIARIPRESCTLLIADAVRHAVRSLCSLEPSVRRPWARERVDQTENR